MTSRVGRRWGLLLAAVVVLALGATLVSRLYASRRFERAVERFEAEAGSLDFATYAPSPIEDRSQNAALWLRAGAEALILDPDESALVERRVRSLGAPWAAEDAEAFRALLAEHEPARRLMDRAAGLERSSFEIEYRRGADAGIPDFLMLLRAGRLLAVECDLRQQQGELTPALSALHLLERLTAVQRSESVLIALLAGAAVERLYLDRLEAMLQVADLETLRALRRGMEHLDQVSVPPHRPFAADTAAAMPWLSQHFGESPVWTDSPQALGVVARPLRYPLSVIGMDRIAAARLLEAGATVPKTVGLPTASVDPEEYTRDLWGGSRIPMATRLARVVAPNYLDAIKRVQWVEASRTLGRLALDLRLARLGHGGYPPASIELPASAATGETAVYRRLDDGSVEIAFPDAEALWTEEQRSADLIGKIQVADVNLRWMLPP